jgi:hypothetical protein
MIGYSGTKMYLHNFEDLTSYILLENQSWNMRTQILTVRIEDRSGRFIDDIQRVKFKLLYCTFD